MRKKIFVYGENHTDHKEVNDIIKDIMKNYELYRKMKPIVLDELWYEDKVIWDKAKINYAPLEDDKLNLSLSKLNSKELPKEFSRRETSMKATLRKTLYKHDVIFILVGDTHIRKTINGPLGPNVFRQYLDTISRHTDIKIYRSKKPEIV